VVVPGRSPDVPALGDAARMLASGDVAAARRAYSLIEGADAASVERPVAVYQLASIDALEGRLDDALRGYRRIVEEFPTPDLYDRAAKAMSDILLSQGRYEQSLEAQSLMVYCDSFYSREQMEAYRVETLVAWARTDPGVLARAVSACRDLVSSSAGQPTQHHNRLRLAGLLIEAGDIAGARAEIETVLAASPDDAVRRRALALAESIDNK
jgi:tetratricopeptide (TPR) repeat protein